LQRLCDRLSPAKIDALLRKWLRALPHPFSPADRAAGYRYDISMLQAEFSLTQMLDAPLSGRVLFEEVIREKPGPGPPGQGRADLRPADPPPRQAPDPGALADQGADRGGHPEPARGLQAFQDQAVSQARVGRCAPRRLELSGITDIANRKTHRLSGGQTQRVRVAVALVSNPDLLVLDEPTVAMDVEARRDFWSTMRRFAAGGKTIVFATHYLEEADAFAERIILMAQGRIVADGPATEIKATVGLRTIRATLPGADLAAIGKLPGVNSVEARGEAVLLSCSDSDAALRALLPAYPRARDIEVSGAGLEAAFLPRRC
jgi:hypothetical protein